MNERYRYGLFLSPQPTDEWLFDLAEAERRAQAMSLNNLGTPVAVWDSSNRTLKLYAGYEEFVPGR